MTVRMILAVDHDNAIGWSDGRLPWHLPNTDMKRFKELTTGGRVLMGYNTFKSLGRPKGLPNRENFVLTSRPYSEFDPSITTITDFGPALRAAHVDGVVKSKDIWIIGGAQVYAKAIDDEIVDEIYLTIVHESTGADVHLKHHMVSWKLFILDQAKLGVNWQFANSERALEGDTHMTFINLRKVQ